METVTANIENKTAEVGSIISDMASERTQPAQMAQFMQKEIDAQKINSVVAALTTVDRCCSISSAADGAPAAGPAAAVPDKIRSRVIS